MCVLWQFLFDFKVVIALPHHPPAFHLTTPPQPTTTCHPIEFRIEIASLPPQPKVE